MKRREFIALLGGAAAAWPLAARAQQPVLPVVGFIRTTSADDSVKLVEAFRRGLGEAGYVEGRNVVIEYRYAQGQIDRLPALAADLVARRVAVLAATGGTVSARAAKAATSTIPVVFTTGDDPVKAGLVASLSRPGGNVTGVSVFTARLGAKRLALLHELIPAATTIAVLLNPKNPDSEDEAKDVLEAARALGVQILVLHAGSENEIDDAFTKMVEQRIGALMLGADTFFTSQRARIATLSTYLRIPTADSVREFPEAGGFAKLRSEPRRRLSSGWRLRGAHSQGRQARRPARPAAHRVRVRHQPQDGQDARPRSPARCVRPRRRGD